MMNHLKEALLLLILSVTYGICSPGYRRNYGPNGELIEDSALPLDSKDEAVSLPKGLPLVADSGNVQAQGFIVNSQDQDYVLKDVYSNNVNSQASYKSELVDSKEDEPQIIEDAHKKPAKPQVGYEKSIYKSESKHPVVKVGSIDPYGKLESLLKGIMSRVLQAEITSVRVEEREREQNLKRKKY